MQGIHFRTPAIVTHDNVVGIETGKRVCALIKASHVMLAVAD